MKKLHILTILVAAGAILAAFMFLTGAANPENLNLNSSTTSFASDADGLAITGNCGAHGDKSTAAGTGDGTEAKAAKSDSCAKGDCGSCDGSCSDCPHKKAAKEGKSGGGCPYADKKSDNVN